MSPRNKDVSSPTEPQDKRAEYVALAKEALVDLVLKEKAVTWLEVEAKLAEADWVGYGKSHMPHSLTAAKVELARSNRIRIEASPDGITLLSDPRVSPRNPVLGRKRALARRYQSWAMTNDYVGSAGEIAVSASLRVSGGMQLPTRGEQMREILGHSFDGPIDAGGYLPIMSEENLGAPTVVFCPIEVKNTREWIYPHSQRLYQLLDKAASLQLARPQLAIHPVLICRRVHYTTYFMAKQLGFKIQELDRQYVSPLVVAGSKGNEPLDELRNELGMTDLTVLPADIEAKGNPALVGWFSKSLAKNAEDASNAWRRTVLEEGFHEYFAPMRTAASARHRELFLANLRRRVKDAGLPGGF